MITAKIEVTIRAPRHRVDVLAEVRGAPDLAVERRAPVGVQVEEDEERNQEQRRIESEGSKAAGMLTCRRGSAW